MKNLNMIKATFDHKKTRKYFYFFTFCDVRFLYFFLLFLNFIFFYLYALIYQHTLREIPFVKLCIFFFLCCRQSVTDILSPFACCSSFLTTQKARLFPWHPPIPYIFSLTCVILAFAKVIQHIFGHIHGIYPGFSGLEISICNFLNI